MLRKLCIFSLTMVLSSCAMSQSEKQDIDINDFASLLENTFETAPDNTLNIIQDRRVRVYAKALDGIWFYTQLNTGSDRKLYRQRLSNLTLSDDGNEVIQKTYGFIKPELFENAWEHPERLAALTPDDFESYFSKGCEQVWTPKTQGEWTGYVNPQTCIVASKRRNKNIRIESEAYLSKDIYRTNERGYEMDMSFLWGTKPGEYIELYPVR